MSQSGFQPKGVLISADSISGDGDIQGYDEFVVTLEEDGDGDGNAIVDIQLNDKKQTSWMVKLADIEGAIRLLRRRR